MLGLLLAVQHPVDKHQSNTYNGKLNGAWRTSMYAARCSRASSSASPGRAVLPPARCTAADRLATPAVAAQNATSAPGSTSATHVRTAVGLDQTIKPSRSATASVACLAHQLCQAEPLAVYSEQQRARPQRSRVLCWRSPTLSGGAARCPPRISSVPRTSGSSWSSARNTRNPFGSVTCARMAFVQFAWAHSSTVLPHWHKSCCPTVRGCDGSRAARMCYDTSAQLGSKCMTRFSWSHQP